MNDRFEAVASRTRVTSCEVLSIRRIGCIVSDYETPRRDGIDIGELDGRKFYATDDGSGIPESDREAVFGSGYSTAVDGIGFELSIVEEIATARGWDVDATAGDAGGAPFEITGVEFVR